MTFELYQQFSTCDYCSLDLERKPSGLEKMIVLGTCTRNYFSLFWTYPWADLTVGDHGDHGYVIKFINIK